MNTWQTVVNFLIGNTEYNLPSAESKTAEDKGHMQVKKELLNLFSNPTSASFQESLDSVKSVLTDGGIESLENVSFQMIEIDDNSNVIMQTKRVDFPTLDMYAELAGQISFEIKPERKAREATDSHAQKVKAVASIFSAEA